jgi:hypothetical protein
MMRRWCVKNFEEFWERCLEDEMFYNIDRSAALMAWEAATLVERERCEALVIEKLAQAVCTYSRCLADRLDYYGGKMDALSEVLDAIRNP